MIAWTTYCVANVAPMPAMSHSKICDKPTLSQTNISGGTDARSSPIPPTAHRETTAARVRPTSLTTACSTLV